MPARPASTQNRVAATPRSRSDRGVLPQKYFISNFAENQRNYQTLCDRKGCDLDPVFGLGAPLGPLRPEPVRM